MRIPPEGLNAARSRPRVLVAMPEDLADQFFPVEARSRLGELAEVVLSPTPQDHTSAEALPLLRDTDVIITGWGSGEVTAEVLDAAPRLRAVVHSAGTVRGVVSPACYERGVLVSSQAWANARPVSEYTLSMILLTAKGVFGAQQGYRPDRRPFETYRELVDHGTYGCRVGIIGASTIGRQVIELLRPFDLEVVLDDPTLDPGEGAELGVELLPRDEVLSTSRVVSLHAPVLPTTIGMIGARELALLSDGATFINTARGALVDEPALVRELESGRVSAVLDVTDPEPPVPESPLWRLPNVLLTPHVAGAAGRELHRLGDSALAEVGRVLSGESLEHGVTRAEFDARA